MNEIPKGVNPLQCRLAVSLRGVQKRYHGGNVPLQGIDLDLPFGTLTVLAGVNGAGKTTLLRIIACLQRPTSGTINILGITEPRRLSATTARAFRRRLGYVSQEPALDAEMTGLETLQLMVALYGLRGTKGDQRIDELAAGLGIDSHLDHPVASWSGGLKRRLHLAAGIVHDPDLLLLDEPTAGLDPEGTAFLWADLQRRAEAGQAIFVVTHDLEAAERHSQCTAILNKGLIIAAGRPIELMSEHGDPNLAAVFRRCTGQDTTCARIWRPQ